MLNRALRAVLNVLADQADRVAGAVAGNFAGLDSAGNLTDSGKKAADFDVAGAGAAAVSAHNTSGTAHADMRELIAGAGALTVNICTDDHTLAAGDNNGFIVMSKATLSTLTIPAGSSVTSFDIARGGSGNVMIKGASNVTVNGRAGAGVSLTAQYKSARAVQIAANTWIITGNVASDGGSNDSYVTLLLHFDGDITDASSGAKTITDHGTSSDTANKVFGSASRTFGESVYASAENSADFNFGAGDFTIDFRVRFSTLSRGAEGPCFLSFSTQDGAKSWEMSYYGNGYYSPGHLMLNYSTNGNDWAGNKYCEWTPSINTWYHVAFVRNGSTLSIFIDGTLRASQSFEATLYNNSSSLLYIGRAGYEAGAFHLVGNLDEVRISKGIARWTESFVPPIAAYA